MKQTSRFARGVMRLSASAVLALASAAGLLAADFSYEVTVTNLTRGQILSPAVVAVHDSRLAPVFETGSPAADDVALVAEDARLDPLLARLQSDRSVKSAGVLRSAGGPILPGESATLMLSPASIIGLDRVSIIGMLVTTNDGFYGVNGVMAPSLFPGFGNEPEKIYWSPAYDAGSEYNSESCAFIPGPPCGQHVHDPRTAEGFIHIHAGIHGIGDLSRPDFDWRNPVARISIRIVRDR